MLGCWTGGLPRRRPGSRARSVCSGTSCLARRSLVPTDKAENRLEYSIKSSGRGPTAAGKQAKAGRVLACICGCRILRQSAIPQPAIQPATVSQGRALIAVQGCIHSCQSILSKALATQLGSALSEERVTQELFLARSIVSKISIAGRLSKLKLI